MAHVVLFGLSVLVLVMVMVMVMVMGRRWCYGRHPRLWCQRRSVTDGPERLSMDYLCWFIQYWSIA
jgi:hypothetical protein